MIRFKYGTHISPWYPSAAVAGPVAVMASGREMEYKYGTDGVTILDVRDAGKKGGEQVQFEWKS